MIVHRTYFYQLNCKEALFLYTYQYAKKLRASVSLCHIFALPASSKNHTQAIHWCVLCHKCYEIQSSLHPNISIMNLNK
jgi:hypothetical protein